jgi:hypothetical protein
MHVCSQKKHLCMFTEINMLELEKVSICRFLLLLDGSNQLMF